MELIENGDENRGNIPNPMRQLPEVDDHDEEEEEQRDNDNWLDEDVEKWLYEDVELGQYEDAFIRNGIDNMNLVKLLREDHLHTMGIWMIGHQMKILNSIKLLK